MANDFDEPRSWVDPALEVDALRRLLEAVKVALEAHDGALFPGDLAAEAGPAPGRPAKPQLHASNDNLRGEGGEPHAGL